MTDKTKLPAYKVNIITSSYLDTVVANIRAIGRVPVAFLPIRHTDMSASQIATTVIANVFIGVIDLIGGAGVRAAP